MNAQTKAFALWLHQHGYPDLFVEGALAALENKLIEAAYVADDESWVYGLTEKGRRLAETYTALYNERRQRIPPC